MKCVGAQLCLILRLLEVYKLCVLMNVFAMSSRVKTAKREPPSSWRESMRAPPPLMNAPKIPMNNTMGGGRPTLGRRARAQWATNRLSDIISTMSRANFPSEEIEELIANDGADPNVRDEGTGLTLLMKISTVQDFVLEIDVLGDKLLRTFTFLLKRPGIDVNIAENGGERLIHLVIVMRDPRFLSLLLENSLDACQSINTPFHPPEGKTPLHLACERRSVPLENIQVLLAHGADPNLKCAVDGRTPLQYLMPAYAGRDADQINKVIAIIHEFFKNPNTRLGDPTLIDNYGQTLLHYAAGFIHSRRVCDMLLRRGEYKSIKIRNRMGYTPIEEAIRADNTGAIDAINGFLS